MSRIMQGGGLLRRSFSVRLAMLAWAALALAASAMEARADFVESVSPSSVGIRRSSLPPNVEPEELVTEDFNGLLVVTREPRALFELQSAIEFALPLALTPKTAIVSAVFYLNVASAGGPFSDGEMGVTAYRDDDGVVTLDDFQNLFRGDFLGTTGLIPEGSDLNLLFAFDATAFLQSAIAAGSPFVGLILNAEQYAPVAVSGVGAPALAPRLVVTYAIPEPSSVLMAGIGMAGLIVAGRRGRRAGPRRNGFGKSPSPWPQ